MNNECKIGLNKLVNGDKGKIEKILHNKLSLYISVIPLGFMYSHKKNFFPLRECKHVETYVLLLLLVF